MKGATTSSRHESGNKDANVSRRTLAVNKYQGKPTTNTVRFASEDVPIEEVPELPPDESQRGDDLLVDVLDLDDATPVEKSSSSLDLDAKEEEGDQEELEEDNDSEIEESESTLDSDAAREGPFEMAFLDSFSATSRMISFKSSWAGWTRLSNVA